MNSALTRLGFATHPIEAYRYFVGDGVETEAKRALPEDRLDDEIVNKCLALNEEEYRRRWANETTPYPGITKLLDVLEKRNIPKAILSNKPDDFTQIIVAKLLSDWSFDSVKGVSSLVPAKPNPAGALQIVDELGIAPQEIFYLGDTNTDMQTANSAGMFAAGALWGFRTAEELLENGAQTLVENPSDVLDFLKA